MIRIALNHQTDWTNWRTAARSLALAGIDPAETVWSIGGDHDELPDQSGPLTLPRALVDMAALAIQANHPDRFALLYSLVKRASTGERVLEDPTDPDLALARRLALAVRADAHRMRTHLRFLPTQGRLLGYYAPAHHVLHANARLLARRLPDTRFVIVTPDASAHWNGTALTAGQGLRHPTDDEALQAWWEAYGPDIEANASTDVSIPEAEDLDESPRPPDRPNLGPVILPTTQNATLAQAIRHAAACKACPLHAPATQTVFGEGPSNARIMFVGEQAGDQEDTIGRPFVDPAGQLLDQALEAAGIDRRTAYVTNAVKHFKFRPTPTRRIHVTPDATEIAACAQWLTQERQIVRPRLIVALGGSAARALLARPVTIGRERGRELTLPDGQPALVTVHPSYLLRLPDPATRAREYAAFVSDLQTASAIVTRAG
jgi:DNA polymerase